MRTALLAAFLLAAAVPAAAAELVVHPHPIDDLKAVFGTVESLRETIARARIGGTVSDLAITEGQRVEAGQRLGVVTDSKIALEAVGVEARIQSAQAQRQLAQTEFDRAAELFAKGVGSKSRVDVARTQLTVAERAIGALTSERSVLTEHGGEGAVLAPTTGRVLKVMVTDGSVVLPGEPIATIAVETYVLRILLPERHARAIKVGDTVWVGPRALALDAVPPRKGVVRKVYPRIENGRVTADVDVDGLGDYFVGERILVWVSAGERESFIVPASYIITRFGIDYARVRKADGSVIDVPVQRGRELPRPDMPDALEILSGLRAGDTLVHP